MAHLLTLTRPLPTLSENARLRYATFIALYFAQGIPAGFTAFAIPAWLAMHGSAPAQIAGYSAVAALPWSLKLVVAPVLERFTYLPMGRRRPWLLLGQAGLVASFLALMLLPDPLHHLPLLAAAMFGLNTFVVMQDVATDSLAIDIVPTEQQGRANSLMWGAKTVGIAATLAAGTWLLNHYGFARATLLPAGVIGLISLLPLLLRERPGEKRLPWTAGMASPAAARLQTESWAALFRAVRRVFGLRNSLLVVPAMFLAQLCQYYLDTSLPIFTVQQLGWTNGHYAQVYSTASLAGGIVGMLVGGVIIGRFGTIRLLQGVLLALGLLVGTLAGGRALWPSPGFITGAISAFCLLNTLAFIGVLALAMQCCWPRISAVQFTVYMTIINVAGATGTALLGAVRTYLPWEGTFRAVPLLLLAAAGLLGLVRLPAHARQLVELESGASGRRENPGPARGDVVPTETTSPKFNPEETPKSKQKNEEPNRPPFDYRLPVLLQPSA